MTAPAISVRDAAALIACKRDIDWLATIFADARDRQMPALAIAAREAQRARVADFWKVAKPAGLSILTVPEIVASALDVVAAARRAAGGGT